MNPDGIFFSNGPGDPSAVPYAVENAKQVLGKVPVFGICMGHQVRRRCRCCCCRCCCCPCCCCCCCSCCA